MSVLGHKFKEVFILRIVLESLEILCPRQRPFSPCPLSPAPVTTSPKAFSSRKNSLRQRLSTDSEFSSQGSFGKAWRLSYYWTSGSCMEWIEAKDAAEHPQWTGQPL